MYDNKYINIKVKGGWYLELSQNSRKWSNKTFFFYKAEIIYSVLHFPQQTAVISDKYTYPIHMITSSIWN